jgi:uncharacterized protein (DUF2235 family)
MGLWDTVSSIGWVGSFRSFPYTNKLPNVITVRQALAYHETRVYYQPVHVTRDISLFDFSDNIKKKQDVEEVWFAGVHSDVGGSYKEEESGLAMIPFNWMLSEASKKGLLIDFNLYTEVMKPKNSPKNWKRANILHNSVVGAFWVMELLPRKRKFWPPMASLYFAYKKKREVGNDALIHASCAQILKLLSQKQDLNNYDFSHYYESIEFYKV